MRHGRTRTLSLASLTRLAPESDLRTVMVRSQKALPPGEEPPDSYVYNPRDPVPTRGGGLCCSLIYTPGGVYDQRPVEADATP